MEKAYDGLCALESFQIPKPGQAVVAVASAPVSLNCITVTKGEKLQCKNRAGTFKPCNVVTVGAKRAKMHFEGFDKRFDKFMDLCTNDVKK